MDYSMPKQGEQLTLPDGRKSTLQGNFKLKRRGLSDGWEQA